MRTPAAMDGFRVQIYPKLAVLKFGPQLNALIHEKKKLYAALTVGSLSSRCI
jgi:hypothetical protein